MGNHNFFISVRDAAGNPLSGVTVVITWDGANPPLRAVSGSKGPGGIDQPVGAGDYYLRVETDASAGRAVSSQTSRLMRTGRWPREEWAELAAAGYPTTDSGFNEMTCYGHHSWDVEITRTW